MVNLRPELLVYSADSCINLIQKPGVNLLDVLIELSNGSLLQLCMLFNALMLVYQSERMGFNHLMNK